MSYLHWKTEEVCRWLEAVALGEHRAVFHRLSVTGADLPNINTNFMISELKIFSPIQQAELKRALDGLLGPEAAGPSTTILRRTFPTRASGLTLGGGAEPLIQISAQSLLDEGCRHSGWLRKRGSTVKNWKRRYHVLKQGCIYYFKDELARSARGQYSLNNYKVEVCTGVTRLPWAFQLVSSDITKRTWYLVASSEHERNTWMEKIEQDIAEFCAPGTVPRKMLHSDVFSDDDEGLTEDQVVNEMYATAFDDGTPYDPSENQSPPPVSSRVKSLDRRQTPEPSDFPKPPFNDSRSLQPTPMPHQTSRKITPPPSRKNQNPPSVQSPDNQAIYAKPLGEDSDTDAYLKLFDDEDEETWQAPSQVSPQSDKTPTRSGTKKGLAGAVKMLPSFPSSGMPTKPAPYKPKGKEELPSPSQTEPVKKPTPAPRSKQGPPTLPPKNENSDSDHESISPTTRNPTPKTFQHVDRDRADEMLRSRLTDGLYLFRESANAGSEKVLSVWTGDRCRHYKVFYHPVAGYSLIKDAIFPSLWELVEYYKQNLLPKSNYKLRRQFVG
jgi:hypothetical protein